jgi:hypothetical protein
MTRLVLVLAFGVASVLLPPAGAQDAVRTADPIAIRDAVLADGKVVVLRDDGRFGAWSTATGEIQPGPPSAPEAPHSLARDGTRLWCASRTALWQLSENGQAWTKVAEVDASVEEPAGMAVVTGQPLIVLPHRVLAPMKKREYAVPPGKGQLAPGRGLRVHALLGDATRLWIGTGYGEWGGELLGLDVVPGTWVESTDALHYVTGLATTGKGELTALWSMSHMGCDMVLRTHAADGSVTSASVEREEEYGQGLAWSSFDQALYTVETGHLARLEEGVPQRLAALDGEIYGLERKAVGVAPGIVAILPAGEACVFIVPARGAPWHWHAGELIRLAEP